MWCFKNHPTSCIEINKNILKKIQSKAEDFLTLLEIRM